MQDVVQWLKIGDGLQMAATKAHCLQTDGVLLASFSTPKQGEKAVDLGTGNGCIPLLWLRNASWNGQVTGIDCQATAIELATQSIRANHLEERFTAVAADWNTLPASWHDTAQRVVCNPPYFASGSGYVSASEAERTARHEQKDTLPAVCAAADFLLQFGGVFCLCHRPERLTDVIAELRAKKLEPKRIRFVQQRGDTAPWLFLLEAKKGGKSGLVVEPPLLMTENGQSSEEIRHIYAALQQDLPENNSRG